MDQVKSIILRAVEAEAQDKLARAIKRRDLEAAKSSLQEIVESKLPDPKMPRRRITRIYPGVGGSTISWRWVTSTGHITLVANVSTSWQDITLCAFLTYPGIRTKPEIIFRSSTQDPEAFGILVDQVVRQITILGFLHP